MLIGDIDTECDRRPPLAEDPRKRHNARVLVNLKTHVVKRHRTGCSFGTEVREAASESQNSFHVF